MINHQLDQQIREWIDAHRDELLAQWMDLIRIPSVRSESAPGAPYGIASAEVLKVASSYYEEAGFNVNIEKGNHYALADWGNGEKTIGLFGHCDVVPAKGDWLYTSPFDPIIKDGYLIGRGSHDNKSGVMASLAAMRILKELKIPVKSRILAYMGAAEESRMPDMEKFVEQEDMPDLSLVPDSAFPCGLGEKTIYRFMAECNEPFRDILDFSGGAAMNVVLDKATVTMRNVPGLADELTALTVDKKEFILTVTEDTIQLKTIGVPRHGAYPEGSVNGAALAANLLKNCKSLATEDRTCMAQLALWIGDYYGEGLGIAYEDPDFGKLTSSNGIVKTENGRLTFGMDIRFGVTLDHLETEAAVTRLMEQSGWHVTYVLNRKGFRVDKNSPLPDIFTSIYHTLTGSEAKPYFMAGGTYARHLKNAYEVGCWAEDKDSKAVRPKMPTGHGGAHQNDECISIDTHFQAIRVLTHYILACDRYLNN